MKIQCEKLIISDELTINNAHRIYSVILEHIKKETALDIYLEETGKIDLSFVQILYSLLYKAQKLQKKIAIFINTESAFRSLLGEAGFESYFSISKTGNERGFIIEGIFDE